MTEKTAAYTAEQTAEMVAAYVAAPVQATVDTLAEKLGKSVKSVVAKLAREGVYVKKGTAKAAGTKAVTKAELATEIVQWLEMDTEYVEAYAASLAKADKTVLLGVVAKFREFANREFSGT